ncbi:MAG: VCBS repeat-containing protein [Bryobacteraceae bacterium]|nr:VCBS repeat-containing protein [Bryobacteraceae bacterium]
MTAVLGTAAATSGGGIYWYLASRPQPYQPGEAMPEITRTLERKLPTGAPEPRFADVTVKAGLAEFRTFEGARTSQLPEDMGSGAAWGDYDNDGDDDLFLVSAGGPLNTPPERRAPSLLFENLGDGSFRQLRGFPETRILGMGAAWGDYNGDGWLDLVVTGYDTLLLYRNEQGTFVLARGIASLPGFWTGASWADFDRDGNLDLYICGYVRYLPSAVGSTGSTLQFGLEVPFTLNPSSYEPERNLLFHNRGDGTFREIAEEMGVDNTRGRSLSALWHDFNQDGWLDLYVANDISESKLFLNQGGGFIDASQSAWVGEYRGSMGLAAGDYDRDGDDDLFISHWVAQQYALYESLLTDVKDLLPQAARELHFADVAEMRGIGQASLRFIGWGTEFADFDSDSWLDLAVANGSTFETNDNPRRLIPMESFLFWNDRGQFFHNLGPWNKALSTPYASRGLAITDYDNDGALDILLVDHGAGVRLLRNEIQQGNWLQLRLISRVGTPGQPIGHGDGATVVAAAGDFRLRRTVTSASYLSQSSRRVHLGLGKESQVETLEVHWASGYRQTFSNLAANTVWELTEGAPAPRRIALSSPTEKAPGLDHHAERGSVVRFWAKQRAAMDAMKRDGDIPRAIRLFREALTLNPGHEDSRYYLANCLAAQGDVESALAELTLLQRQNPQSHRAFQRWGVLAATTSRSIAQLAPAEQALNRAVALNPEETGSLFILGEIALIRGDTRAAEQRLQWVCRTNPRAVGGFFLLGYLSWKGGDVQAARRYLTEAHRARGEEWRPEGSAEEGDVRVLMHSTSTCLSALWDRWDGSLDPDTVFRQVEKYLRAQFR